jgi:hypothetical protein
VLGQPPGGHILLTNRRDADWRRLAVRPRAWSSVLPATAQAMTADPSSSTSTWSASLVAAASPVALSANEDPGPRDLVEFGLQVVFRHPLVRFVVYHSTPFSQQRRIHRGLAAAGDAGQHPDRVAWHSGMASRA